MKYNTTGLDPRKNSGTNVSFDSSTGVCTLTNVKLTTDKLYIFAKQYQSMSAQEQVIYLAEAEKIFTAFDKVPEELWDEEYEKYKQVLKKYKDIKMFRWASN